MGRTILGPKQNILSIKRDDLSSYIKTNYTADRMVLVGTGGVDHEELVKLAEKHFSSLPVSSNPIPLGRLAHHERLDADQLCAGGRTCSCSGRVARVVWPTRVRARARAGA